jgi:CRP-like cAMP-binding protein
MLGLAEMTVSPKGSMMSVLQRRRVRPGPARDRVDTSFAESRLLSALTLQDREHIKPYLTPRTLPTGQILFEPGQDVDVTYFPWRGMTASLLVISSDGREVEAASVGHEGAIGGIVSAGHKPAYGRAIVRIGGSAFSIETARLEEVKARSPAFHDLFSRYADVLLAQMMQSVACNALHSAEARCARWLLTIQDRVDGPSIPMTQEALAEMLGVQRTTVTAVVKILLARGLIRYSRGRVEVVNRRGIEAVSCECYEAVESHFARLLPKDADAAKG